MIITNNISNNNIMFILTTTAWKVSKYGVFSGPYFSTLGLNTERERDVEYLSVFTRNTGKYGPANNFAFGHYSRSVRIQIKTLHGLHFPEHLQSSVHCHSIFRHMHLHLYPCLQSQCLRMLKVCAASGIVIHMISNFFRSTPIVHRR